jgi:hypothetical protein
MDVEKRILLLVLTVAALYEPVAALYERRFFRQSTKYRRS